VNLRAVLVLFLLLLLNTEDGVVCKVSRFSWVWWQTPVIPALRRLRQEDGEYRPAWAIN
jgi:hypothetical protein